MSGRYTRVSGCVVLAAVLAVPVVVRGQQAAAIPAAPAPVAWSARDVKGAAVGVPSENAPTLVAFLRADQPQSKEALAAIRSTVAPARPAQVVVVVSGPTAEAQAKVLDASPYPVVADPDFSASGKFNVHVWPTTLVVSQAGEVTAAMPGMPASYAADLAAHLDFALKKIDRAGLDSRLTTRALVADSSSQAASRHLTIAQRLLDNGQPEKAKGQLEDGLKLHPEEPGLQLELARTLVALGDAQGALTVLDHLKVEGLPGWRVSLVKGRALVALKRYEPAKVALTEALKLNPSPAEPHYLLGKICEEGGDYQAAAREYRAAFEATGAGQKVGAGR